MREEISTVAIDDPSFPSLLREIHDPPQRLSVRGVLPTNDRLCFAVVGSRIPSAYGKQATPMIVEPLAAAGLVIVSGLAYGIDALAHEASIAAGGMTVAVLGTGVDEKSLYPQAHRKLAQRIVDGGGAVISEYPEGTPGHPGHFPARNRIIAGLSRGVLIVEAKEKSGALITADLATRENRDVFAVPGPITSPTSVGPNRLLRDGANPVLSAKDILEEYGVDGSTTAERHAATLTGEEQRALDMLSGGAVHVDALARTLEQSAAELSVVLVQLELRGLVRNLGGGMYGRA